MRRIKMRSILLACSLLLWLLAACSPASSGPSQPTPSKAEPSPTYALATPYAQQPAAGICQGYDGAVVTITINVDAASPRCAKVRSDQTLAVVNSALSTIQVSIGNFSSSTLPGAQYSINVPFGDYLEAGVHQLSVTPYFGAELWLEAK